MRTTELHPNAENATTEELRVAMEASPKAKLLAIANHRNEVLLADLEKDTVQVVARSEYGRSESLAWSPDGAWLAFALATTPRTTTVRLYEYLN